jgi:hypothetical protein
MRTPLLAGGVLSQMRVGGRLGGVTEWLMVADCKSAGLTPYVGSNPTPTIRRTGGQTDGRSKSYGCAAHAGVAQLVEHQPSKLRVAGSSPVARFEAELTL